MAFVNEKISEEDVRKYGIDALWDQYHPFSKGEKLPGFYYDWTIDRERNVYLIWVAIGREELYNRMTFVLVWQGEQYEIDLNLSPSSSPTNEGHVITIWDFVYIISRGNCSHSDDEVIVVLKEALAVFKRRGIKRPIEDHTVIFNF